MEQPLVPQRVRDPNNTKLPIHDDFCKLALKKWAGFPSENRSGNYFSIDHGACRVVQFCPVWSGSLRSAVQIFFRTLKVLRPAESA